ncbi:riboflavin deaminase [Mastigocoleus testarum BC008]|uniref:Riboflavin deaminase n=1 Tax=Mastigocoleus testarum BC008 TaxID=371196 RepID=A0A0V7ZY16_9CYAN|nr:riboflavin deaminase [Mastigocoleus testarum BC008]KST69158.1 riboflavin deaminase [Mastigocoleus testarum BC008]
MQKLRPYTTIVLAMSADGKIADYMRSPARFGSKADKAHLEKQIAGSDAVLFGAGTLRAYNTTLTISNLALLQYRNQLGYPPQPIHITISKSGDLDPDMRFFEQPVRRWLISTSQGARFWQQHQEEFTKHQYNSKQQFEKVLVFETQSEQIDITAALEHLVNLGINRLAVLGGGELVAAMLELGLIDELWLSICPLILGGQTAPTPVDGSGFISAIAPRLRLLSVNTVEDEVFLHYRFKS